MFDTKHWAAGVEVWQGKEMVPLSATLLPLHIFKAREKDFIMIKPGESTPEVIHDLSEYYNLNPKTEYHVKVIMDAIYFTRGRRGCKNNILAKGSKFTQEWTSSSFQLHPDHLPSPKKYLNVHHWVKENQEQLTEVSKGIYLASELSVDKAGLIFIKQLHKVALQRLKFALHTVHMIHEHNMTKAKKIYEKWFGEPQKKSFSTIVDIYRKAFRGMNKRPMIYAVLPSENCHVHMFGFSYYSMRDKKQPLFNLCGRLFYRERLEDALAVLIRGMASTFAGTTRIYESVQLPRKPLATIKEKALLLAKKNPEKAITSAENIAQFAVELPYLVMKRVRGNKESIRSTLAVVQKLRQTSSHR